MGVLDVRSGRSAGTIPEGAKSSELIAARSVPEEGGTPSGGQVTSQLSEHFPCSVLGHDHRSRRERPIPGGCRHRKVELYAGFNPSTVSPPASQHGKNKGPDSAESDPI
ncbi:hypothetical protein E7X58_36035 [Streptomyces sp. A1499]|nr:hypothetical protein E7X58_36035 [Streptomyces sp. A1499]